MDVSPVIALIVICACAYYMAHTEDDKEPLDLTNVLLPITVIRFRKGPTSVHDCECDYGLKVGDILTLEREYVVKGENHVSLLSKERCDCGIPVAIAKHSLNFHQAKIENYNEYR